MAEATRGRRLGAYDDRNLPSGEGAGICPQGRGTAMSVRTAIATGALVTGLSLFAPATAHAAAPGDEHISTPQTVAGLTMTTNPDLLAIAKQLESGLQNELPNTTGTASAFYEDPSDPKKLVLFVGVTGTVADPAAELDNVFAGAQSTGGTVTDVHPVDPGTLPGEGKCGKGQFGNNPAVTCAWADPGSVGALAFLNRDVPGAEKLFPQIRDTVLTKE